MLSNQPGRLRLAYLMLFCLFAFFVVHATAQASVSLESRVGSFGPAEWARVGLPLSWGENTLLFADLGVFVPGEAATQTGVGIGFRRHHPHDNLVAGGYVFLDQGITEAGHPWGRLTVGYELLGPQLDLHINGYIAERIGNSVTSQPGISTQAFGMEPLVQGADTKGHEPALTGYDIEIGRRMTGATAPTRAFLGFYSYRGQHRPHMLGVRVGIEAETELDWPLIPVRSVTARISGNHDTVRGSHVSVGFELRFLGGVGIRPLNSSQSAETISRMLRPVRREVEIVTPIGM